MIDKNFNGGSDAMVLQHTTKALNIWDRYGILLRSKESISCQNPVLNVPSILLLLIVLLFVLN